jgi:hypothetical protein
MAPTHRRQPKGIRPLLEVLEEIRLLTVFTVSNTNNLGPGSLRQAILDSNASEGGALINRIDFNIPGQGVQVIQPVAALPQITSSVVIDGTSQPGTSSSPLIEIDGELAIGPRPPLKGPGTVVTQFIDGLDISAARTKVLGLVINHFGGAGIRLTGAGGDTIQGNFLGTDPTGTSIVGNHEGDLIVTSANNTIGGATVADRNILSGGGFYPLSPSGMPVLPTMPADGVLILGSTATGNVVAGNYIGTDVSGRVALGNVRAGIVIAMASGNTIGGATAGDANLISGNFGAPGIVIIGNAPLGVPANDNVVEHNIIGTDVTQTRPLGNGWSGISINGGSNNRIGGPGAGNAIGANTFFGVDIVGGTTGVSGNVVQGNTIGAAAAVLGNHGGGVAIVGASGTLIGGTASGAGNSILNNIGSPGIVLLGSPPQGIVTAGTVIQGNSIGTDPQGVVVGGNVYGGIVVTGSSNNIIGGLPTGAGNTIAFNIGDGVSINSGIGNTILSNSIANNMGLDIHLFPALNQFIPPPVLTSVTRIDQSNASISGALTESSQTAYTIQFFADPPSLTSGSGGPFSTQTLLGTLVVTTGSDGKGVFSLSTPIASILGHTIRATATDPKGNTSEFSLGLSVSTLP